MDVGRPLVIGHRGAPAHRPEHTLASYVLAARRGADLLEPDLVATADGVLVVRHDVELSTTTDIADRPAFADRRTTRQVDGESCTGWFVDDLTLAELRTLRTQERWPALRPANTRFDGRLPVLTFTEVLALRARLSVRLGRTIGVYPETKHPRYFADRGRPLEPLLVDALRAAGLDRPGAPVFVQSFDAASLQELAPALGVPLVQLVWDEPLDLDRVAGYADAVGVAKHLVMAPADDGRLGDPAPLVADAHAAGLAVHAYTFRDEHAPHGDGVAECVAFLSAGVDGLFADDPATAVTARALTAARGAQTIRWSS